LGFGLYVHPISVVIALASAAFIVYMVLSSQPMSRQTLNYVGFAVLVMIIIGMPYLISTIRTPELSGFGQLLGNYDASQQSLLQTIAAGLSGIIFRGDHNPAHNLPGRPLVDLVSGLLILLGLMVAIRFWRQPRFALPLIVTVLLAPVAFLTSNSPDFLAFSALLPLLALFFGLGVNLLFHSLRGMARRIGGAGLVALLAFNLLWLAGDLFEGWPQEAAVQTAYNHHLLQLSQYVEATATTIPTVMCTSNERLGSQIIQWMSSRPLPLRYAECQSGLVLAQGGETQQVILPEPEILEQTHPHLRDWLLRGTFVDAPGLPQESILTMNVVDQLADAVGRFTTTAPLRYAPEAPGETGSVIAPPVRFGGNVTFLGYALDETETYLPGETITAITYWRADGMIPPDLLLFTHVLSDPVSIIAQIDIINVDPRQLQDRDVFIQVTHVPLPAAIPEGDYLISVGAYQASSDVRLDVLEDNQPRGTRLFLYPIRVTDETGE
jgi:hypothetical protein